jgi:hypothetical protein
VKLVYVKLPVVVSDAGHERGAVMSVRMFVPDEWSASAAAESLGEKLSEALKLVDLGDEE